MPRAPLVLLYVAMAMTFLTLPILGATKNWIGGHGPWSLAGNWNSGTVPALFDAVNITPSNGLAVTVNYDVSAPTLGVLTVELTGPGTSRTTLFMPANNLTTSGFLLGSSGRGTFDQSGGRITTNHAGLDSVLGHFSSGDGIYNLGGTGALSIARDLYVGNFGTGAFNQTGGTNTINSSLFLAAQSNSFGGYAISGSALSTANEIIVGRAGTGTLNITSGGEVSSTTGLIGALANSDGTATINGLGSKWTNSGELNVGFSGTGALRITDGGFASNARGAIAERSESSGSVTVNGVNSRWQSFSIVTVGVSGTGTLSITGGGAVANLTGSLASNSGANGSATIDGPGSMWMNDGDLTVGRAGTGELSITSGGVVSSTNGRIARDAGSRGTVLIDGPGSSWLVDGDLTMGQTGTGTASLSVRNGGVVSAAGVMIIGSLGTVRGDGTIAADVFNAGTIAPGTSPGTLLVNGNFQQSVGGRLQIELAAASFDKLDVSGEFTLDNTLFGPPLGGTLEVSLIDGYVPYGTQSFDILDWSGSLSGTFTSIQLPTLGGSLIWDTSQLYVDGILSVTGPASPAGDYNDDGIVDAADYVVWRKQNGTQPGYDVWRANFGQSAGSGAVDPQSRVPASDLPLSAAVPEPATWATMLGVLCLLASRTVRHRGTCGAITAYRLFPCDAPRIVLFAALAIISPHLSGSASGSNWTNPGTGSWFLAINWSRGVPSTMEDANIPQGNALLSGPNNPFAVAASLRTRGGGSLVIFDAGRLTVFNSFIGELEGANSFVTVRHLGSSFITDYLAVGYGGSGTLLVERGGRVESRSTFLASDSTSNGSVTVTGTNSILATRGLVIGDVGTGSLTISDGGWVAGIFSGVISECYIGNSTGSTGSVTVTGANSLWTFDRVYVGGTGTNTDGAGSLQISSGGLVQTAHLNVFDTGSAQVNNGSSTVSGLTVSGRVAAAAFTSPLGALAVGNTTSGRMVVETGGTVSNSFGTIAGNSGTIGSVLVQGAGSTWTNTDQLSVGHNGTGTLEVRSGGTLRSFRGFAGTGPSSTGSIIVSDPGSTWTASGSFFIGNSGSGLLQVLNGGVASTTGNSHLGITAGATGDVIVIGAGSTWNTAVLLNIGGDSVGARGAGSVRIADGGTVNVGTATNLYSTGTLDLANATTLTGDINAFGGLIRTVGATTLANAIHLNLDGMSVETNNQDGSAVFSGNLNGPGGLTKRTFFGLTGTGTLTLAGANTYTGPTTVNGGTLLVDGSSTSATTVNAGATLGGSGTIAANVMNNGIVAPGNSPGTLMIDGTYAQAADGELLIELAPTSYDQLLVTGDATLAGTLTVSLLDGFVPSPGQSFTFLMAGVVDGTFASEVLPSVPNLGFDIIYNPQSVILMVSAVGVPGDYNQNGTVDAADYVVWRKNFGSGTSLANDNTPGVGADDYARWRAQFGKTLSGAALGSSPILSVPEPATMVMFVLAMMVHSLVYTRQSHQLTSP